MEFRYPWVFLFILVIPFVLWLAGRRKRAQLVFSTAAFFPQRISLRVLLLRFVPILRGLALSLILCALARPERVSSDREYQTKGVDIMISLDLSGSMLAEDFKPSNRLVVAKQEAAKFIRGRENDRIGLVVFAKKAFTQCPLTLDYEILIKLLNDLQIGMIE